MHMRDPLTTLSNETPRNTRCLSTLLSFDGEALPTEFRLFKRGANTTSKGTFIFDDVAAASVMASYAEHGVELMIDLEHLSVAPEVVTGDGRNYDPDARGWFTLEVRDGELWACSVRWTPDGERRLRTKAQRYISPAFGDDADGRITHIHNVALTATPATHEAQPLVAASARKDPAMTPKEALRLLNKIAGVMRGGADCDKAITTLAIDMKTLQAVVKAMGGDAAGDLGSLIATVSGFAQELVDAASGKAKPEEPKAEDAPAAPDSAPVDEAMKVMSRQREELKTLTAAHEALKQSLASEKAERELGERRSLVASLVVLGRETPATAWVGSDGKTPRGSLLSMPIGELRDRVREFGGVPQILTEVQPPTGRVESATSGAEISDYEAKRVEIAAKRLGKDPVVALSAYREVRNQRLLAAKTPAAQQRFGRKLEQAHVIANTAGVIGREELTLLTNPVKPIEQFGTSSQRALEEFNITMMVELAALPADWTGTLGTIMPSGALKETYPLDFSAVDYRERKGQNALAETPQSRDISVTKREFRAAKQGDMARISRGDFAYIHSWQAGAGQMARARVKLRGALVAALLEAGATGYWGSSTEQPTGIDGQPFFSASHKVHPFDDKQKWQGSATWGNYVVSATPFSAANLTAQKAAMVVPFFDGLAMDGEASDLLLPRILKEEARLLIDVKDFVLDAIASLKSVSNVMGSVKNEHFNSGLGRVIANQLTGSLTTTADWYLASREIIAQGFVPWIVSEDAAEEVLTWDESSDFYKDTGFIKTESKLFINACLLWPHGIRWIKGA